MLDDDEILDWWECHSAGMNVSAIALKFGRRPTVILREFRELGIVLYEDDLDSGELAAIAGALERCRPEPHVEYARSMQHVKLLTRRVPMSARQRRLDRQSGQWRDVIRADLKAAGLLP